jgi:hypothetical protein
MSDLKAPELRRMLKTIRRFEPLLGGEQQGSQC